MSSTPIERQQSVRTRNEGPTTTTHDRLIDGDRTVATGSDQQSVAAGQSQRPGELSSPWVCGGRLVEGKNPRMHVQLHAERTTPEDLHWTPPLPRRQRGDRANITAQPGRA